MQKRTIKTDMNIKSIGHSIWTFILDYFRGELLMKLGCGKYFMHIVLLFILFWGMILFDIVVENRLYLLQKNKQTLSELQIYHTEKMVELARFGRITSTEKMLRERNSTITYPTKPANRLDVKEK